MREIYIAHCLMTDGERSFAFDDPVNFMLFMDELGDHLIGLATEVVLEDRDGSVIEIPEGKWTQEFYRCHNCDLH